VSVRAGQRPLPVQHLVLISRPFSALNAPSWYTNRGLCFGPQLGYTVPPAYLSAAQLPPEVASVLLESILVVLVLHPIAAAFSFLALLFSLYLSSQAVSICGLVTSIIASLLVTILFAFDLAVALVVRSKVNEFTDGGFVVTPGNAVWMTLVAAILSWAGVVLLSARVCFCCGIRRSDVIPVQLDTY
jgi:hypothetical protein